jgi:hypothetical protein
VYAAIGFAAVAVAAGIADQPTGSHGVMRFLARQELGPLLLLALGAGFAGYAALNITGAISDPERRGESLAGMFLRTLDVLTGALYVALSAAALALLRGARVDNNRAVTEFAERVIALPFGRMLLVLGGVALIASCGYLLLRAFTESFGEMLDKRALSRKAHAIVEGAARAGTVARSVIFGICGAFAIRAGIGESPESVGGVDDALRALAGMPFGRVLLAAVGAGFVAYGVYQLAKARYQRITAA